MLTPDEITHQTNRIFPVLHYLYENGEFDNVVNDIKSKLETMTNKNNIKEIGKYLGTLNEATLKFVISQMNDAPKILAECSNPCTGQGSTPYGHWTHDSQCNCVWVPEFGG